MAKPAVNTQTFSDIAERSVIGSILIDPNTLAIAREIVKPQDFYVEANRAVFTSMCAIEDASQPVNVATIYAHLATNPSFNNKGGIGYLMDCEGLLPSAGLIAKHCGLVRADSIRRRLSQFSDRLKELTGQPIEDADATIAQLSDELLNLSSGTTTAPWIDFKTAIQSACKTLTTDEENTVIESGFIDLDAKITGFRPGSLTIIAARPAMGKTAFGLNIMEHAAFNEGLPVAFFSLEMTAEELTFRTLSCHASVNGNALRQKTMTDAEWNRVLGAAEKLSNAHIYIDETPGIDIATLRDRAKRMRRQHGIRLIIIDYLQLVTSSDKKAQTREQEIATISRNLKDLAKTLHIPVIALAQIKRDADARADKRPVLSDLRESGSVEQDADRVMFIYRDDYYKPNAEQTHEAEIIIAKQRSGPTGIVKLHWAGEYTRFSNLESSERFG
jgi:replicative DNA helicase